MKHKIIKYKIGWIVLFLCQILFSTAILAKDKDKKETPKPVKPAVSVATGMTSSMELQLNSAISKLEQQLSYKLEQQSALTPDRMVDIKEKLSPAVISDRSKAGQLMAYLDQNPDKVRNIADLNFADITTCPIGVSFLTGTNASVMLGILEARIDPADPSHAKLLIFMRIKFELNGVPRDLFFGVDNLRFTKKGFVDRGGFKAVLLGDYVIPGKKWSLLLKGGSGVGDRSYNNTTTFIDFDCNEFSEASLAAEVVFPRSDLLPYDPLSSS
jgi:hypothetical protein